MTARRTQCEDSAVARRKPLTIAVSAAITVGLLALLFRAVPVGDLFKTLREIHIPGLFLYLAISLVATAAKAARAKWLLAPFRISWPDMFLVTFVRNGFEDLLPARLGSLSYVVVLNKKLGCPFETAASTLVVMLVFDFLTLSPFVLAALLLAGSAASILPGPLFIGLALGYFAVVLVIAWKIVPLTRFGVAIVRRALDLFKAANRPRARRALAKLDETVAALAVIQARSLAFPLFLVSAVIRLLKYLSLYALLLALVRHLGIGPQELALWKVVLGITAAELTSLLPVKGLADFGTWESAWVLAFALMGLDRSTAVLSGFSLHLMTNLFEYGFALLALLAVSLRRRKSAAVPAP